MNLQSALSLIKDHAEKYVRYYIDFFRKDSPGAEVVGEDPETLFSGAILYMVVGVTLQDRFISKIEIAKISWFDRAVTQLVFWVTAGMILHLVLRVLRSRPQGGEFLAAFRVMPIAFLSGAYAASLGSALYYVLTLFGVQFVPLPNLAHVLVQLAVIALYLPRNLRRYGGYSVESSRMSSFVAFLFVLVVDFVFVFGRAFESGAPPSN